MVVICKPIQFFFKTKLNLYIPTSGETTKHNMYFPDDIMKAILSYLPMPYRKPPHLDAFKEIRAYCALQDLEKDPEYQEALDTPEMYMNSSLYRFIMDDYSFLRRNCDLEGKWNPFMARYCSRMMSPFGSELVDLHFGDRHRHRHRQRENGYAQELLRDFCNIQDHLLDIESLAWWFY